ncbi:hypothetical protein OPV22_030237 [Ensete ventricosum]|uniref:Uncharacterized protein n=1 Tax=Ensete ventricosum TaxID=4639 RepID=A0AAV8PZN3_ENSVE|nr:hypothetical protein OPV22_030237 [Ensete ventricosum]
MERTLETTTNTGIFSACLFSEFLVCTDAVASSTAPEAETLEALALDLSRPMPVLYTNWTLRRRFPPLPRSWAEEEAKRTREGSAGEHSPVDETIQR